MGFHTIPKKYYFGLSPGDENVIGIRAFKTDFNISENHKNE